MHGNQALPSYIELGEVVVQGLSSWSLQVSTRAWPEKNIVGSRALPEKNGVDAGARLEKSRVNIGAWQGLEMCVEELGSAASGSKGASMQMASAGIGAGGFGTDIRKGEGVRFSSFG